MAQRRLLSAFPTGVCRTAFTRRLSTTCRRRFASPATTAGSGAAQLDGPVRVPHRDVSHRRLENLAQVDPLVSEGSLPVEACEHE